MKTALWPIAAIGLLASVGCAQIDSLEQALGPKASDEPVALRYTIPTVTAAAGAKASQTLEGVELKATLVPIGNPHVTYLVAVKPENQPFTLYSNPPHTSADPIWSKFDSLVYEFPAIAPTAPGESQSPYRVTLQPEVNTTPSRLSFKLAITNHTVHILKIDITPEVALDGKAWDNTIAKKAEGVDNSIRLIEGLPKTPSTLTTAVTLAPGASESWEYGGPWTQEVIPNGNNSGGTIVLVVPDIVVNPVTLHKVRFQFVYNYTTKEFTQQASRKSSGMLLRNTVASQLDGFHIE